MAKKKESALHKKLAGELISLIPDLDEEGLAFLVEQAGVHLHNMEVERIEAEMAAEEASPKKKGSKGNKAAAETGAGDSSAAVTGVAVSSARPSADYRIERSPSGASYHIITRGKWKMFSDAEMLRMVKIARSPDSVGEVAERLYHWLDEERPDAFTELDIESKLDPRMTELVLLLRAKFAVKDAKTR